MRPALPVDGVQVILGNELVHGCVEADSPPSPVVTCSPSVDKAEVEDKDHPQVSSACVVTRAQASSDKNQAEDKSMKNLL